MPIHRLLCLWADTMVVPEPQKGSNTRSSSLEPARIKNSTSFSGYLAGCAMPFALHIFENASLLCVLPISITLPGSDPPLSGHFLSKANECVLGLVLCSLPPLPRPSRNFCISLLYGFLIGSRLKVHFPPLL